MKEETKKTKIYWAPFFEDQKRDWTILYSKPQILFNKLRLNMVENLEKVNNLFGCPAVRNFTSKTIIIKNPIETHYEIKEDKFIPKSKNWINISTLHKPNLKNCNMFQYNLSLLFFSEDNTNLTLTSPYFSNSPHLKYANIVPGKFNISKWFRPINFEFNTHENIKKFEIEEDEDLAYINFDCDNEIELIQFHMNDLLIKLSNTNASSSDWEKLVPLDKRYKRFVESNLNTFILKEIKKNII